MTQRVESGRGITTTYGYDALNRPTGASYSDGVFSTPGNCVAGYGAAGATAGAGVKWLGGGVAVVLGAETGPADIAIAYGGKVLSNAVGTYVGQQAGQLLAISFAVAAQAAVVVDKISATMNGRINRRAMQGKLRSNFLESVSLPPRHGNSTMRSPDKASVITIWLKSRWKFWRAVYE